MITISITNRKGGAAKTFVASNLAFVLSCLGYKVLLVDLDAQASSTKRFSVEKLPWNLLEFLDGLHAGIQPYPLKFTESFYGQMNLFANFGTFFLIPGDPGTLADEIHIRCQEKPDCLKILLDEYKDDFDICIIDCPATIDVVVDSALLASDYIIVPVMPEKDYLDGLDEILGYVGAVNPKLRILGIVLSKFVPRELASREALCQIESKYKGWLLNPPIREDANARKASFFDVTMYEIAPKCKGSKDLLELANTITKMLGIWKKRKE